MQTNTTAITRNNNNDVQTNNNHDVQIIHDLGIKACKRRRMKRMNLLREKNLGHHQWHEWKLNRRKVQHNERQQKNTEQHRMARAHMKVENFMKCEHIKYKDADRHRKSRLLLSNEQLDYFRHQDADRHRAARANLTDDDRKKIRQKNAFQHKMVYTWKYVVGDRLNREVTRVLEYHRHECKQLGECPAQCNYREIYDYVHNEEERLLIQKSRPGCHFRWKY